ncbi:hypothetical protein CBER1_04849 [Cercospora berteroae]|uniref:SUR7 family protein pun1 n=1 Tax=Cercospora berteroae TaxID=357750 RepID=A0A2S6BRQ2_9PEZI|nr:hypothetical protein CBER1_04849 [Cercospora berteroae]
MFGRKKKDEGMADAGSDSERTVTHDDEPTKAQIKRATRQRFIWALLSSFLLLISVVFLILVEMGNTSISSTVNKIWFIRLDLSDIIPVSVPNAVLINSIAQSLGLHDFYTVGLWNYCEGYEGQGVTNCSPPETLYWFNPVAIVQSQLLAGATIALPAEINDILDLIRLVSNWMFGLFLTGLVLDFIVIFLLPLSVFTRWLSLPLSIITFVAALLTTAAAIIATVMFIIMQNAITSATELNIRASIGTQMFVFMWIASTASVLAFAIQLGMCCCCASRRDVRTGRRMGSKKAWTTTRSDGAVEETSEKKRLPTFGRNKRTA